MPDEFEIIVKGALLHDIGKFIQRAQERPTQKNHRQWGYEWLQKFDFFKSDPAINSTIMHHSSDDGVFDTNIGLIWYESDNLAYTERKEKDTEQEEKWDMFTPIVSPFFKIRNPKTHDRLEEISYYSLKRQNPQIASFEKPEISINDYKNLLEEFEKDLKALKGVISLNSLLMLFEKHLSNVPSITLEFYEDKEEQKEKHPDISLYNHCKLTSAIAGCMYHFYKEMYPEKWNNNELLKEEMLNPAEEIKPFLLIGGDISGVQKFIYTITSKGALKSLKGRSFYLELLTEHIISDIIDKLILTRCNIIFSGGGQFYILAYNTEKAKRTILYIKKEINDFLFNEFKGDIFLNLEYVEFNRNGFKDSAPVFEQLSEKMERSKKKKWFEKINDYLKTESQDESCFTDNCAVCFREDLPLNPLRREDESINVCEPCSTQYKLGNELLDFSKGKYPVIYKLSEPYKDSSIKIANYYYFFTRKPEDSLLNQALAVYRINSNKAEHYIHPNTIYLPVGLYKHEELKELSNASETFGINRIAVLRMDVDNLGKIFSQAVSKEDRTFSRMASISNGFTQFFKYHLNEIVAGKNIDAIDIAQRNVKQSGRNLMIVYSGGDDVFIVGHWLDVFECACDIRNYFEKYTGNKFITLSAGLAMNHKDYPIYQYAKDAEELEKIAKDENLGKNAIALLYNQRISWQEINKLIERINLFISFLKKEDKYLATDEDKLPKTFFYRLLSLARKFQEEEVLILPKAAYLISRAKFKNCEPENINKIKEVIMNANEKEWKFTEIATLITLMLMRRGGDGNARS
jgi:CRISPR-associated protein Csm1